MRHYEHHDALARWQADLTAAVVTGIEPHRADAVVAALVSFMSQATAITTGGMTMIDTTTAATTAANATAGAAGATATAAATGSLGTKLAAGALAATLVGGGAAAANGDLPAGIQSFVAEAASHIGLDLPRPQIGLDLAGDLTAGLGVGEVIDLGAAGSVSATVDATAGLVLTGIDEALGFTADVVSETSDTVMVRFESATESVTVLLSQVDGRIVASLGGDADLSPAGGTNAGGEARVGTSTEADGGSASTRSDAEVGIGVGIGR